MTRRGFGSDNQSGIHPRVLDAIARANDGHAVAYGDDEFTSRAVALFREMLGDETEVHFVFGGTGANVTALASVMRSYESVICAETAHINVDECGAPERFTGGKLIGLPTPDGKLTPQIIQDSLRGFGVEHHSQPRVISISQVSELGTVYTPDEVRELASVAHAHGMMLHMDGARISNAAASLGVPVAEFTTEAGVDVLSFGGTKNGMAFGEAVVHSGDAPSADFAFVRKQCAQLPSKMRYVACQFIALLEDGLWLETAGHANSMAAMLAEGAARIDGVRITQKVQANEVFAEIPSEHIAALQVAFPFYVWDERRSEVRWVTSWDTTPDDVETFLGVMRDTLV